MARARARARTRIGLLLLVFGVAIGACRSAGPNAPSDEEAGGVNPTAFYVRAGARNPGEWIELGNRIGWAAGRARARRGLLAGLG